ncbi:MAG TPA: membrane protein insertase YidC [Chitinophagaceae bacterium]|nr:membrane protein insertase YidC [Chitinophagaceae bacterium]
MDKNTIMGFGLLLALMLGMMYFNQKEELNYKQQQQSDTLAQKKLEIVDSLALQANSDTIAHLAGDSSSLVVNEPEEISTIENEFLIVSFTNKGAYPVKAELKKFKTYDGRPLLLFDGKRNLMDYSFKSTNGHVVNTKDLTFISSKTEDQKVIQFTSAQAQITYKLDLNSYLLNVTLMPINSDKSQNYSLQWDAESLMTERDIETQKMYSNVCYNLEKDGYDFFAITEKKDKKFNESVKWLSFKQHYFNTTLITSSPIISKADVTAEPIVNKDTSTRLLSDFHSSLSIVPNNQIEFQLFYGPNDYKLLKSYGKDLEEIVPLSYGIFGFVKYINKWIVMPIFDLLSSMISSYGLVILILTFIIRLLMSPFSYKSYVSSAKMKALKPEMDELKAKYGEDKQAFGVEQMKLYRQAGVNPLGGCLPALLQLPVFFALLSFFPHSIQLRQEKFLWANDLSTYDSILDLPFTIPFYGNHISLFTILFVITSILMSLYSMNMTADQSNPMMKYVPFVMPVMFLGIFNKLPAALTYYYFVSNLITLILQFVIQNYIIDPDKIHAQIQAKKSEKPKESKFMQRMQELQKQQQEKLKKQNPK